MNEKSKAILSGFSGRKERSQLASHRDLICKLHQRGCTFREIVRLLAENFNLSVAPSTVYRFIARMEQEASKQRKENPFTITPATPPAPVKSTPTPAMSPDEARQRIAALKQQTEQPKSDSKRFEYNPDQPLHLVREDFL